MDVLVVADEWSLIFFENTASWLVGLQAICTELVFILFLSSMRTPKKGTKTPTKPNNSTSPHLSGAESYPAEVFGTVQIHFEKQNPPAVWCPAYLDRSRVAVARDGLATDSNPQEGLLLTHATAYKAGGFEETLKMVGSRKLALGVSGWR